MIPSDGTIYSGIFFYSLIAAAHVVIALYSIIKRVDKASSPQSFFNYTTIAFCILRLCDVGLRKGYDQTNIPYYFNRFAWLLFLTALSITLYTWMAALGIVIASDSGLVSSVRSLLDKLQWTFIAVNIFVYVISIITIAMYATNSAHSSLWYDASIYLAGFIFFVMALIFVIQSIRLYNQSEKCSANVQTVLFRAAVCSMIVSVFFLMRFIFLMYRPLSGGLYLDVDAFTWSCYYLPEMVPLIVSLVVHWYRVTNTPMSIGYGERDNNQRNKSQYGGGVGPRGQSTSGRRSAADEHANGTGDGDAAANGPRGVSSSGPRGVANSSSARYSTDGETEPDYPDMPDEQAERRRLVDERA